MAKDKVAAYKIIVIGGSAGSFDVVLKIIASLPSTSNVSIVIILHRKNDTESILTNLFASKTTMQVSEVEDKESILPNTIYIAPADYHLLIENENMFTLDVSEKVHYSRPSIDVTFESVATIFGASVIGILLSGANADGAAGLQVIKEAGGFTIVQNPATAQVDYMPKQAIKSGNVDAVLDADEIGTTLKKLLAL